MNLFDNREKAFEDKFARDAELDFRIAGHAAHLFGLWIAKQMGLKPVEAEAYAQKTATTVTMPKSYNYLIAQAEKDLRAKNVVLARHRLERQFEELRQIAHEEIAGSSD